MLCLVRAYAASVCEDLGDLAVLVGSGLAHMCLAIKPFSALESCGYVYIKFLKVPVAVPSEEGFAPSTASQRGSERIPQIFTFPLVNCLNR